MSSAAISPIPAGPPAAEALPRSWVAQVVLDTVGRAGARVGLVWIAIVALCAIFAPVLANSYPILIKIDNRWSSPMLRHMTAVDFALLSMFVATLALWRMKFLKRGARVLAVSGVGGAVLVAGLWMIQPTQAHVYDEYRVNLQQGKVQWVLNAPIPYSPSDRLRDQFDADRPHPWPPSAGHWLGTEINGADIASNLVHACRIAMSIGFISTGIAMIIGIIIGGLMGYFVGAVDLLGMRLVEIFGSIPTIYLLLTFVAYYERNIYLIMVIIGLTSWVGDARFVRAEFLKLRNLDFVHAAVAAGLPLRSVLFRHLLPNALAPLLVSASFGVAGAIIAESTLSFIGLGLIDEPSWGRLLNQAVGASGRFVWWLALFPGLVIFLTVLAYNLVGEAMRDALDPKLRGGRN